MQLAELQKNLVDTITGKQTSQNIPQRAGIELYRSLILSEYTDLLETVFPAARILLGERWDDICLSFVRDLPGSTYNFNRSAGDFSRFVAARNESIWIVELCDYEYLLQSVRDFDAKFAVLGDSDDEFLRAIKRLPLVNPTAVGRSYTTDAPALLADALQKNHLEEGSYRRCLNLVVFRDVTGCRCLELSPQSWTFFSELNSGLSFSDCIQRVSEKLHQPVKSLAPFAIAEIQRYFREGLLVNSIEECWKEDWKNGV